MIEMSEKPTPSHPTARGIAVFLTFNVACGAAAPAPAPCPIPTVASAPPPGATAVGYSRAASVDSNSQSPLASFYSSVARTCNPPSKPCTFGMTALCCGPDEHCAIAPFLRCLPGAQNAVSVVALECVHDGGSCNQNTDCCSGECDFSNGSKVCFPKRKNLTTKKTDSDSAALAEPAAICPGMTTDCTIPGGVSLCCPISRCWRSLSGAASMCVPPGVLCPPGGSCN